MEKIDFCRCAGRRRSSLVGRDIWSGLRCQAGNWYQIFEYVRMRRYDNNNNRRASFLSSSSFFWCVPRRNRKSLLTDFSLLRSSSRRRERTCSLQPFCACPITDPFYTCRRMCDEPSKIFVHTPSEKERDESEFVSLAQEGIFRVKICLQSGFKRGVY